MGNGAEKGLKGIRALVIDDDPILLIMITKFLSRQGCEVVSASNVNTALEIVNDKEFDVVICDLYMERLGGPDFYRIVKERHSSLIPKIIFSTGDTQTDLAKKFIESVQNPCIEKPYRFNELKELIIKIAFTSDA